jgi:hypothetical protein
LGVYVIRFQADALVSRLLCLLFKEMQHPMGEARTIHINNGKQPSVSEGEKVLGVYVIRSQADALVCRLLCLLSKEMQHQMAEARTIQRSDAKQPSVSGGDATLDGRIQNSPKK